MAARVIDVVLVAAARPNFMKVAPLYAALSASHRLSVRLVHAGQHYDPSLSDVFFRDLGLPRPDVSLEVGSASHGAQTARVLERFERVLCDTNPDLVVVVGDVNSTLGCALAAAKMLYADGRRPTIAHVEAGLRSFDRSMPEEINRVLTDALSDFLFTTEETAAANLLREGIPRERIFFVGNVMVDTLLKQADRARELAFWQTLAVPWRGYALVTVHRPSNVDDRHGLGAIADVVCGVARRMPVVFPIHPRTANKLDEFGLLDRLRGDPRLRITPPLGYVEFLSLMTGARLVLTDSGGIQEETTALAIPCLTIRTNTERPVTLTQGTNRLVGTNPDVILNHVDDALNGPPKPTTVPDLWDGQAAERIRAVLENSLYGVLSNEKRGSLVPPSCPITVDS